MNAEQEIYSGIKTLFWPNIGFFAGETGPVEEKRLHGNSDLTSSSEQEKEELNEDSTSADGEHR